MFTEQTGVLFACLALGLPAAGFLLARLLRAGEGRGAASLTLAASLGALVGARLLWVVLQLDWFFMDYGVSGLWTPVVGGFSMLGGVLGAALGVWALARAKGVSAAPLLDETVVPGLAAIALCRLAEFWTGEGIGPLMESEGLCFFPLAVENAYGEWNLAVFVLEALAAAILAVVALRERTREPGERWLRALLRFCCCQIFLENMRSDNCLRVGFVRVSQVLAALVILAVALLRARACGRARMARRAAAIVACAAAVGLLEWAQDKTNIPDPALYTVMAALCLAMGLCAGRVRRNDRS